MPSFNEAYPELAVAPDKKGRAKVSGAAAKRMTKLVDELIMRMNKLGWKKATVISLHAFPVTTNLGYNGPLTIRGRKVDAETKREEPFVRYVIKDYLIQPHEAAEGERYPEAIVPVEIAAEFIREMRQVSEDDNEFDPQASVGIFWYEGDSEKFPQELMDRARFLLDKWYDALFEEAENNWAKSQNRREISERAKDAARYLHKVGKIDKLPEWTRKSVKSDAEVKKDIDCPGCGSKVPAGAAFCVGCQTMLDPERVKKVRPDIYFKQRPEEAPKPKPAPAAKGDEGANK